MVSASGRLTRQTTPSGVQVDMAYGLDGRPVEILVNHIMKLKGPG